MAPKYELHLPLAIALLLLISTPAPSTADGPPHPRYIAKTYNISWRYGSDYQKWAGDASFHVNDILVFVYGEGPNREKYPEHAVDLMKDKNALDACQFGWLKSRRLGVVKPGQSVRITLSQLKAYYVASGRGDDCSSGDMKFSVWVEKIIAPAQGFLWVPRLPTGLALILPALLALYLVMRCTGWRLRGARAGVIKKSQ